MDFSNVKTITIEAGEVKSLAINGVIVWSGINNLVETAIDSDGSIYNNTGYMDGKRLSSSGGVSSSALAVATHTGFIKFVAGDIIRIKIVGGFTEDGAGNYFNYYNTNFGFIKADYPAYLGGNYGTIETLSNGDTLMTLTNYLSGLTEGQEYYIRISLSPCKGENIIVTLNEEI